MLGRVPHMTVWVSGRGGIEQHLHHSEAVSAGRLVVVLPVFLGLHALRVLLLHPGLNHLDGRSIDVALVEGDLEVVPRLGYLNRTSSLFWLAVFFLKIPVCWIYICLWISSDFFLISLQVCTFVFVSMYVIASNLWYCLTVKYLQYQTAWPWDNCEIHLL